MNETQHRHCAFSHTRRTFRVFLLLFACLCRPRDTAIHPNSGTTACTWLCIFVACDNGRCCSHKIDSPSSRSTTTPRTRTTAAAFRNIRPDRTKIGNSAATPCAPLSPTHPGGAARKRSYRPSQKESSRLTRGGAEGQGAEPTASSTSSFLFQACTIRSTTKAPSWGAEEEEEEEGGGRERAASRPPPLRLDGTK